MDYADTCERCGATCACCDYCGICNADRCDACAERGCCGHAPMISGMTEDRITDDLIDGDRCP